MYKLISCVLGSSKQIYLKFCRNARVTVLAVCAVMAIVNSVLMFFFHSAGQQWGGFAVYALAGLLAAGAMLSEQLFPYAKILREQLNLWYLSEHKPLKEERYVKRISEDYAPFKKFEHLTFYIFYGMIAAGLVILPIILCAATATAYQALLAVCSFLPMVGAFTAWLIFCFKRKPLIRQYENAAAELGTAEDKEWKKADGSVLRPKKREVELKLSFGDEIAWRRYRLGRLLFVVFAVTAFVVFFVTLPAVIGWKSGVGTIILCAVFYLLLGGALAGHIVQSATLRKSYESQPDTLDGNYRKCLCGLHLGYYRDWGRMCAGVLLLLGTIIGGACLLQYFGIISIQTVAESATSLAVYMVAPTAFLALLTVGAETRSGYAAFKSDYVYFSGFLHALLLEKSPFSEDASDGR